MKKLMLLSSFSAWLGLFAPMLSADETPRHVQHDAHEHGAGQLNLVLEKHGLMLELRLSAMDAVGFGHAPHDDKQKKHLDEALRQLQNAAALFTPDAAANCEIDSAQAKRHALRHEEEHDHADDHGHDHGHDHDTADKHEAHEETHEAEEERHAEFHVRYGFQCAKPEALKGLDIHVFRQFPSVQKLHAQVVTEQGQTALQLTPRQTYLSLP